MLLQKRRGDHRGRALGMHRLLHGVGLDGVGHAGDDDLALHDLIGGHGNGLLRHVVDGGKPALAHLLTLALVIQIDDDIKCIGRLYTEKGENAKLDKDEAYDIIQYIGNCARLAGAYLFGLSKECNPLSYNEMKPIQMTGILNGDIGLLEGSKLFFHELAKVSEDYWISAYNAYVHRYCWIDTRFSAVGQATFGNTGGCANIRTKEQEAEDTMFLRKMFGEAIKIKGDTKLATRKHEFQRTLTIPY